MPGFPVHHQLLELAQTHAHWVSDSIQSFQPLSSSSPPAFNLSQHHGLFQWVGFPMSWFFTSGSQSIGASASASVLPMNIQGWFPLRLTGFISLHSKGLSRVFSSTTIWKHQFFGTFFMVQLSHPYMTTGKAIALTVSRIQNIFITRVFLLPFAGRPISILTSTPSLNTGNCYLFSISIIYHFTNII